MKSTGKKLERRKDCVEFVGCLNVSFCNNELAMTVMFPMIFLKRQVFMNVSSDYMLFIITAIAYGFEPAVFKYKDIHSLRSHSIHIFFVK